MINGPICPSCSSGDTETLFQMNDTKQNECLSCGKLWSSGPTVEIVHKDPLYEWAAKGEEI